MKSDITNRKDIGLLIHQFYEKLLNDENISYFFNHIQLENKLQEHLETIIDFWEDILFGTIKYGKNAMKPHFDLHKTFPFKKEHFSIWLNHFNNTVDINFKGKKSNLAKTRALSIATIMQIKLQGK